MDASSAQVVSAMMSASLPAGSGLQPPEEVDDAPDEAAATSSSSASVGSQQHQKEEMRRCSDELDRLGRRLDQLVSRGHQQQQAANGGAGTIQPSPRKNSAGSHIPAPDTLKKSPNQAMSQSLKATSPPSPSSASSSSKPRASAEEAPRGVAKPTTSSMLKSTLKRMTRLTISKGSKGGNVQAHEENEAPKEGRTAPRRQGTSPSSVNRTRSFRVSEQQQQQHQQVQGRGSAAPYGRGMSNSLRRPPKNRDPASTADGKDGRAGGLPGRTGTGGTLERRSVSRSHSVQGKRTRDRDRDLNVRKSRGVQTQLTRDVLADEDQSAGAAEDGEAGGEGAPPTSLNFALYMPGVLGSGGDDDDEQVETHLSEPTEPMDVRKNRQLTLENMKLQREVERLKSQLTEGTREKEGLRREKRTLTSRLEDVQTRLAEEEALRLKLEQQMDRRDEKMREIAMSMENVEREFENRDENIQALERRVQEYKSAVSRLQADVDSGQDVISDLRGQLERSVDKQKILLQQLGEVETEARELQEFLQAEKMTLAETLKDCEGEIGTLKASLAQAEKDNTSLEERCSHLVRLCEQRYQENLAVQAQLTGVQERAKDMLLAQGAEISRAAVHVSELHSRLERLVVGGDSPSVSFHATVASDSVPNGGDAAASSSVSSYSTAETGGGAASSSSFAGFSEPRSSSQFLVPTLTESSAGISNAAGAGGSRDQEEGEKEEEESEVGEGGSESLQNLSEAIARRQRSENGHDSLASSSATSLPSLVERIHDVQNLIEKLVMEKK